MRDDLFEASIDGIALAMEAIDDTFDKAIARYEYPYVDGADLEDLGLKARTLKFRCYFWDNDVQETYDEHKRLLAALAYSDLHELIHPAYGALQGCIESIAVRHDDRKRVAEIDITFVQQMVLPRPIIWVDVSSGSEQSFLDGQSEQMDELASHTEVTLGAESHGILSRILDPNQGILAQFQDVSQAARGYLKKVDTFVAGLEAELNTITNPANGLIATINYGVDLPGRVIGAVARCAERYTILYESLKSAPARFLESFRLGMLDLEKRVGIDFGNHVRIAAAQRAGLEAGYLFKSDEQERQKLRRIEQIPTFDALGRYAQPEIPASVMTARELEACLAIARTLLKEGIDQAREMQALKSQARLLLEHVNTVKLESEKIVTVSLDNAMPLHLVCLKYGLSYNYAERIYSLNEIKNPNFTNGEIKIYAR